MARTRTLHPVRALALHYIVTRRQRHAKPLVYAGLSLLGRISAFVLLTASVAAGQPPAGRPPSNAPNPAGPPCLECQALSVLPEQIGPLPGQLQGTRVLVRVSAGTAAQVISAAVAEIRRRGGRPGVHVLGIPGDIDPGLAGSADLFVFEVAPAEPDQQAFALKQALTRARAQHPAARLLLAAPADTLAALKSRGLDPYLDGTVPRAAAIRRTDDLFARGDDVPLRIWTLPIETAGAAAIAADAAALQPWFPAGLVLVRDRSLHCGEDRPLRTFLNPQTLDLVAVSAACPAPAVVTSDIGAPVERLDAGGMSAFRARVGTEGGFATGVNVAAARPLTVEEVIARHQAAAARQAAGIATDIADGSMTLTFEAPGFVAPVTVTSHTTIYTGAGRTDLRQRDIRVNGVRFDADGGVPRLPIIEPERAAAPPLAITLSDLYTYRLAGRETIGGRPAYVVAFAPRDRGAALFSGRAWIDEATFGMMRVSAVQTGLRGPITASEQTDENALDAEGRWLLARSDVHQTYEGASIRTPIHRRLVLDRHDINAPEFTARRIEAYASRDVMLRDTPEGYRYLRVEKRKSPDEKTDAGPPADRVIAGRADRIRTLAFGVIVDPNISQPLPFAGLSYVDFNLFGTGTQFSGFFGGSYGQVAFSAPSVRGTRWQLAGRAFGIATSYNDRAFEQGREQYGLDIRQRPAQAAIWLVHPLTARVGVRVEYDWDYNAFAAGEATDPLFRVPRNQNAHAVRLGLDVQRAGWQGSVWGSYARRVGWRPWGLPAQSACSACSAADYQRYGGSLLRSQAVSTRLTARVEGAIMSGRDLDRFSRYAFGTFDNRLHGYPAALIRYDRGAVLRTAVAWAAARAVRLDAFADTAAVHDPGFGAGLRNYTGFGAALEAPAPFRTLLSLEWGYGLQGIDTEGRRGTNVVRISGYKVF
jgi:hypothetical protein